MSENVGCLSIRAYSFAGEEGERSGVVGNVPAKVVFFPGASMATAVRELVVKECASCGETFKVERYRLNQVHFCQVCRSEGVIGGERGEILGFSAASRRRLMRMLNQVQKDIRNVSFVTLTFGDEYGDEGLHLEPTDWKRRLRMFEHRFRREFPEGSYVWRQETEERKSGRYIGVVFPHFHLLVFGVEYNQLRWFVADHWNEIAGFGSEEHKKVHSHKKAVTRVVSRRGIMRYASKGLGEVMAAELGKTIQALGGSSGRWWGVAVRKVFETFLAEPVEIELSDGESVQLIRYFRKYIDGERFRKWRQLVAKGLKVDKPAKVKGFTWRSLTVFLDGDWLNKNLARILSPPNETRCYRSTRRRFDEPFWKFAYYSGLLKPELEKVVA